MKPLIEHVALRVTDMDRSIAFYRGVMGFAPAGRRRLKDGREMVAFRVGETVLVLFQAPGYSEDDPGSGRGMDHLAFHIPEPEYSAILERLAARGGRLLRRAKNLGAFGLGYAAYFHDPDKHELEIKRYDDPPEQPDEAWHRAHDATEGA